MNKITLSLCTFIMLSINVAAQKTVIAHRGASGYLPEHTLESKVMAHTMGVQYIEQDVVLTKDDVPIVIHDLYLNYTTNVSMIFPKKKRKDGKYYVVDFEWEELQQLEVTERRDPGIREPLYKNRFPLDHATFSLHTLEHELQLIQNLNKSQKKDIGIYVKIKDPKFHREEKKDISTIVLNLLKKFGYDSKENNCYIQSFDASELQRIKFELKSDLKLVQLYEPGYKDEDFRGQSIEEVIEEVSKYVTVISPWYKHVIGEKRVDVDGIENLVTVAHENNLKVHAFTLRKDNIGAIFTFEEILNELLIKKNVDGVFTDHPDKVLDFIKKNL